MEIVVSEGIPSLTTLASPASIFLRIVTIYYSYLAMLLALSYYVHFIDARI